MKANLVKIALGLLVFAIVSCDSREAEKRETSVTQEKTPPAKARSVNHRPSGDLLRSALGSRDQGERRKFAAQLSDGEIAALVSQLKDKTPRSQEEEAVYYNLLLELAGRDPQSVVDMIRQGHGLSGFGASEELFRRMLEDADPATLVPILEKLAGGKGESASEKGARESLARILAKIGKGGGEFGPVIQKLFGAAHGDTMVSIYFGALKGKSPEETAELLGSLKLQGKQKDLAVASIGFASIREDPEYALEMLSQADPRLVGSAYGSLLTQWLDSDPKRAVEVLAGFTSAQLQAALINQQFVNKLGAQSKEVLLSVIGSITLTASTAPSFEKLVGALATKDRQEAERVIAQLPQSPVRDGLVRNLWAGVEVDTSSAALNALSAADSSSGAAAAGALLSTLQKVSDAEAATFVNSAPAEYQSALSAQLISNVNSRSAEDAAAMLKSSISKGQLSGQDVGVAEQVLVKAANGNLERAQSLADELPEVALPSAYAGLMAVWSHSDPAKAAEWLDSLAAGPARDAAARVLVRELEPTDPALAAKWKATIGSN